MKIGLCTVCKVYDHGPGKVLIKCLQSLKCAEIQTNAKADADFARMNSPIGYDRSVIDGLKNHRTKQVRFCFAHPQSSH